MDTVDISMRIVEVLGPRLIKTNHEVCAYNQALRTLSEALTTPAPTEADSREDCPHAHWDTYTNTCCKCGITNKELLMQKGRN